MRIAAALAPVADWPAILEAARSADEAGLDAIGFWDHYHSLEPELAYIAGWSAYGGVADRWPDDVMGELAPLAEKQVDRVFVSIGGEDMPRRAALADAAGRLGASGAG